MEHNKGTNIQPLNTSSSKLGVMFENQFVVLDDAKHVIGVDASDGNYLILENVENRKADKFRRSDFCFGNDINTLLYDEHTGFIYSADTNDRLYQYKVDKAGKCCERVKDYGELGIGLISSSHRFEHLVFFGGFASQIKVLDLSTGELLPGCLETSIGWIRWV